MTVQLRAHFDGRVLVPEEPLDLPVDQALILHIELRAQSGIDLQMKLAALDCIVARAVGANLPAEALTRGSIYEDGLERAVSCTPLQDT